LGVDALDAEAVALRVAQDVGGVVFPTLYLGTAGIRTAASLEAVGLPGDQYVVGMDFPATSVPSYYYPEEILAVTVRATLELLRRQGYRLVVLVNGHAAPNQVATLQRLAEEYTHTTPLRVLLQLAIPGYTRGQWSAAHATGQETALMLALAPETVDQAALPAEGPLPSAAYAIVDDQTLKGNPTPDRTVRAEDDPRLATAAAGEERLRRCVAEVTEAVRAALAQL
jgi:creatinine amidohydrolase/Fe(II)-dependent formamide hydrolase-like protein